MADNFEIELEKFTKASSQTYYYEQNFENFFPTSFHNISYPILIIKYIIYIIFM